MKNKLPVLKRGDLLVYNNYGYYLVSKVLKKPFGGCQKFNATLCEFGGDEPIIITGFINNGDFVLITSIFREIIK